MVDLVLAISQARLETKTKNTPRRDQILETAARLFRRKGFRATSVRMIAADLGMEAASLYNHIQSKQDILQELLFGMAHRFTQGLKMIEAAESNPYLQLEKLVALHVQLTHQFPNHIALITGEWIHLEEPHLQKYTQLRGEYESHFKSIIRKGMEQGYLEKTDVDMALFSILSTLHWLYSWVGRHPEVEEAKLEAEMKKLLLSGIRKRAV